ncbi:hypothetical protein F0562_018725 [Nyssa sinensis]|uniref:Uncharacterized protein n=1 Tax=Nyssa sinensis TaxID=561372 RepID=A0A5J4ZD07_9ASTE|nr:hypothetical protein F0562_018725 [Nyssa sinensis]
MAETILFDTASKFLGDLGSIALKEIALACNVKKDIEKLKATLSTIKAVLLDAEQQQEKNNEVQDWLGKLKHAFYGVDDLIDDFATEALRRKLKKKNENSAIEETLILSDCFQLRELPIDIRKLIGLRHFEIDRCVQLTHMPFGLGELTSLRTLPLFIVGKHIPVSNSVARIGELDGLNDLRGMLSIKGLENVKLGTSKELRKPNLKAKQYLQDLRLEWKPENEDADAGTTVLEDLQPHSNLKKLAITGFGGFRFPNWMMVNMVSSVPNLVEITLAECRKCQHLPWFGQLSLLKSLYFGSLISLEYIHNNSVQSSSSDSSSSLRGNVVNVAKEGPFFPSLKQLVLFNLALLKEWSREVVIANDDMKIVPAPQKVSLLSFPRLTYLEIFDCSSLETVPLLPSLEELIMRAVSGKLLQSMTRVIETDSSIPSSPLPSLKSLTIKFCDDLVSLSGLENLTSLQHLSIINCPKLAHLPEAGLRGLTSLQSLDVFECNSLTSISLSRDLTSLQSLDVSKCKSLTSISLSQDLAALQKLEISSCSALNWSDKDDDMKVLRSLQSLSISRLPRVPHWLQHLTTLQVLKISSCDDFVTLPEWIGNLASLRSLHIDFCEKLESLPDTMRCLTALEELNIQYCVILSERCRRERGTEWPKIAHIPKIRIIPES